MEPQQDPHQNTEKRVTVPGKNGGTLTPFTKGNHPVGSAPKGKRISTWMAEFGDMPPSKWPKPDKLPANGRIAMARVLKAMTQDGIKDTELILDRTEGAVIAEPSVPMLSQIAAAILALKAAGVALRKPIEAEVVPPPALDDEEENERRFRRR